MSISLVALVNDLPVLEVDLGQSPAVFFLSLLMITLHRRGSTEIPNVPTVGLSVIGAALSIPAAFRNSASYERWWKHERLRAKSWCCSAAYRVRRAASSRKRKAMIWNVYCATLHRIHASNSRSAPRSAVR